MEHTQQFEYQPIHSNKEQNVIQLQALHNWAVHHPLQICYEVSLQQQSCPQLFLRPILPKKALFCLKLTGPEGGGGVVIQSEKS